MKNLTNSKLSKMIYSFTGLLIIVSLPLLIFSHSKILASNENAKILLSEMSHDFGKVEQGHVLEYSIKFTNEGDSPLVIEKVQPTCGCTGATTDGKNKNIECEGGEIKISFNTQGQTGHPEKHLNVITNDTENQSKVLMFKCDIDELTN